MLKFLPHLGQRFHINYYRLLYINRNFFDLNQKYLRSIEVSSGESIILVGGGHGIEIIEDTKFIEIKQGPYKEDTDKIRFYDTSL